MIQPRAGRVRAPGFSLIELLVVIAIIALLISIMLPSLGNAREAGRQSVCASNAAQLVKAATLYQTDWKDWINPMQQDHPPSESASGTACEGTWRAYLYEYAGRTPKVFDCPTERDNRYADGLSDFDRAFAERRLGRIRDSDALRHVYGMVHPYEMYNSSGLGANGWHYWNSPATMPFGRPREQGYPEGLVKASAIQMPSKLVFFGDGHSSTPDIWPEDCWWIESLASDPSVPFVTRTRQPRPPYEDYGARRHAGKANYSFADGHVEMLHGDDILCNWEQCWWSVEFTAHSQRRGN